MPSQEAGQAEAISFPRICFLAGTLGQGGAERQLFYILKALRAAGADVKLLSLTQGEYWQREIERLGVPIVWVGRRSSRFIRLVRICGELWKDTPHVIQSQHFYTNLYASCAARITGAHEVGAIRNDVSSEVRANGGLLGRLSLRLPRTVAANSVAAIEAAMTRGVRPERLHLLSNVVDTERFAAARRPASRTVRVVSAGRLAPQKRFDRMLRALSEARKRSHQDLQGVIAGDGPLRPQLEALAAEIGLTAGAVEFLGAVSDIAPVYQNADILLLTSEYEGTPNVILEAMACGLPVVATRVGGVPGVVKDGVNGLLVDSGRDDLLVEALVKLAADPERRRELGTQGRAFVEANHSPASLNRTLSRIYTAALSAHS